MASDEMNRTRPESVAATKDAELIKRIQAATACNSVGFLINAGYGPGKVVTRFLPRKLAEEVGLRTEEPEHEEHPSLWGITIASWPLFVQWLYTRELPKPNPERRLSETIELYQQLGQFALEEQVHDLVFPVESVIIEAMKHQKPIHPDWNLSYSIISMFQYLRSRSEYYTIESSEAILQQMGELMGPAIGDLAKLIPSYSHVLGEFERRHPGASQVLLEEILFNFNALKTSLHAEAHASRQGDLR